MVTTDLVPRLRRGNLLVRRRSSSGKGSSSTAPPSRMASNTTVAIPMDVKNRLDQIHKKTSRDADSAPFWFTIDRSLEAFADEQGVDLDD